MGTSYHLGATIGYVISLKDILEPFTIRTPEVSHIEQHYHPQTKMPLPPKKVVTQKATVKQLIAGRTFENDNLEAIEELARNLDFKFHYKGELGSNSMEIVITSFSSDDLIDEGRFSFNEFSFDLDASMEPLFQLGEKLKAAGISLSKPKFTTYFWWC